MKGDVSERCNEDCHVMYVILEARYDLLVIENLLFSSELKNAF